jgi:hypothetical protein
MSCAKTSSPQMLSKSLRKQKSNSICIARRRGVTQSAPTRCDGFSRDLRMKALRRVLPAYALEGHRLHAALDVMSIRYISLLGRGGDMLAAFRAISRSIFTGRMSESKASIRLWPRIAIATFVLVLANIFAHAQQQFVTFESVLSTPTVAWCIDIPQGQYVAGNQLAMASCTGAPEQTFGSNNNGNLIAAGFCVDAQPPSEGSPVFLNQCDGSDQQVWYLVPFTNSPDVYAIENSDGLCVTINGDATPGTQLVLAQCQEASVQGWVFYSPSPSPPVYGAYTEPLYYWFGDVRYCWYDNGGWNGAGWYICGQFSNPGQGWGGPGGFPTVAPTMAPTVPPTVPPTMAPTVPPTLKPTILPTLKPTIPPTLLPTLKPTILPTIKPTLAPTLVPTIKPTLAPTLVPTIKPTLAPTLVPTIKPTILPTIKPTLAPTLVPTIKPTILPTIKPTLAPTLVPTIKPTLAPTLAPTIKPTLAPTLAPTIKPTLEPTLAPTIKPTVEPTGAPTIKPTLEPTLAPTIKPTGSPTGLVVKQLKQAVKPTLKTTIRPTIQTRGNTGGAKITTPIKSIGSSKDHK